MKHQSLLLCAVLSLMLGGSPPLLADDPVHYIVSNTETRPIEIFFSSVVDPALLPPQIVSWIDPSRGDLSLASDRFIYTPGTAFDTLGTDNFRFTVVDLATEEVHEVTVHLMADVGPTSGGTGSPRATTSGGNTVLDLKIPECLACDLIGSAPIPIARGTSETSDVGFAVWRLISSSGGTSIRVDAIQRDGTEVQTAPIPLAAGPHVITLDWWLSSARGRNGGVLVRRVDTLIASLTGLDNHHDGIKWEFPSESGTEDTGVFSTSFYGHPNATPLAYPARFADTFQAGSFTGWHWPTDPWASRSLVVSPDAAVDGLYGLSVEVATGGDALIDTRPVLADNYHARFHLDTGSNCTNPPSLSTTGIKLLEGRSTGQNVRFSVALEQTPAGDYQLRATSFDDGSFMPTTNVLAITQPTVTVDLRWWVATGPGAADGGLLMRINEGSGSIELDLPLSNANQRLDSIHFGATGSGTGTVCLDEYESWWR